MTTLKKQYLKKAEAKKVRNFKINDEDMDTIRKNADLYTNGNMSAWVRFSATCMVPQKKFLCK